MSEDVALYEVDGNVAIVTLNRPEKRNALFWCRGRLSALRGK